MQRAPPPARFLEAPFSTAGTLRTFQGEVGSMVT